jgi:Mg-chelatase subunit ChlD
MSNIRPWALWRRLQYVFGILLILSIFGVSSYYSNYYVAPTCLDLSLNGEETGVDCGGACVQICEADILPPKTMWVESFKVNDGQYNAIAYIENLNLNEGTPDLGYTFRLYNGDKLVGERSGVTILPPETTYPVFGGRIAVDEGEEVTFTEIVLNSSGLWLPATVEREQFRPSDIDLTNVEDRPRLAVDIENDFLVSVQDVEVVATVFDEEGNPVLVSQTFIDNISPRSAREVVFTWPNPIAKTIKSCEIPSDVVIAIDISSSMNNNDVSSSSQPISKVLKAASDFAGSLKKDDQVAVITFGNEAELVTSLTNVQGDVLSKITEIETAPETGSTNIISALKLAQAELGSGRHNTNSQKILVVLTDSVATTSPVASVGQEMVKLTSSGIGVYSIGLGVDIDESLVENLASVEDNSHFSISGDDLEQIYSKILGSFCDVGSTKVEVIVKPETNFAPIP